MKLLTGFPLCGGCNLTQTVPFHPMASTSWASAHPKASCARSIMNVKTNQAIRTSTTDPASKKSLSSESAMISNLQKQVLEISRWAPENRSAPFLDVMQAWEEVKTTNDLSAPFLAAPA